jgi:hypothetical protein
MIERMPTDMVVSGIRMCEGGAVDCNEYVEP